MARAKGIPYINRPLGHLGQWSRNQKKLKKAIYWQLMERSNISHANALHLTAQDEVDELPDLPEKVIRAIIPHGITPPTLNHNARQQLCQQYQIDDADFIILYLSRIHPKKGIDLLIQSLAQINQGNETKRNFTLILGGSGDAHYQAEITALIERYNLSSRVRQVGFLSGTAKDLALQGADLFALTSYAENFGVVVLESLAAGTPVLLSKGVALSKFVAQEGLGYICDVDVSSIYEQLVLAMTERRKATQPDRINQAIAVTQGNYAWSNIAQQLENLYCEIISSNRLGSMSGNTSTK
jgi:glycosyltransferase involved in cell wall biosynthesis